MTNSVAWMIAYAIELGATDIGLWGINMKGTLEYEEQLPCCMYLLGIARGLGINLHFPEECELFRKTKLYYYL